jgi:hypothetical protein
MRDIVRVRRTSSDDRATAESALSLLTGEAARKRAVATGSKSLAVILRLSTLIESAEERGSRYEHVCVLQTDTTAFRRLKVDEWMHATTKTPTAAAVQVHVNVINNS